MLEKIKDIVESGIDIKVWKELGAEERDLRKRQIVLEVFLKTISVEKPKAKNRKKTIIRQPVFEKGDCLVFKLDNGNYSCVVVLAAENDTQAGLNLIASTRINQKNKPTLQEVIDADILVLSYASWNLAPRILWYYKQFFKKCALEFENIGKIIIDKEYVFNDYKYGAAGSWNHIKEMFEKQFEFEKINSKPSKLIQIKEFL